MKKTNETSKRTKFDNNLDYSIYSYNKDPQIVCNKCGSNSKPSKGYLNIHNRHRADEYEFQTKFVDCLKCENCGHSWIPDNFNCVNYNIKPVTKNQEIAELYAVEKANEKYGQDAFAKNLGKEWNNEYLIAYNEKLESLIIQKKSTREQALEWWNNLSNSFDKNSKFQNTHKAFDKGLKLTGFGENGRALETLTSNEIEKIWKVLEEEKWNKFVQESIDTDWSDDGSDPGQISKKWWDKFDEDTKYYLINKYNYADLHEIWLKETQSKPNQKQFKQFNCELFEAYINKFSDEDKIKMLKQLADKCGREIKLKDINMYE